MTSLEKNSLRTMRFGSNEIMRVQFIEKFTDHDTAAAGDFLKFLIAKEIPSLANLIEGVYFATTSEDVIGNVTGLMTNKLVYHHVIPKVIDF